MAEARRVHQEARRVPPSQDAYVCGLYLCLLETGKGYLHSSYLVARLSKKIRVLCPALAQPLKEKERVHRPLSKLAY